jgi:F0F1-type ATP synthase assembly protein I
VSALGDLNVVTVVAALAFFVGLGVIVVGITGARRGERRRSARRVQASVGEQLTRVLPQARDAAEQNLRLAGITPASFALQRAVGLLGGAGAGALVTVITDRGPFGAVIVVILAMAAGWLLPMLGARSTAAAAREELDQIIRIWVVLVAQQVAAGTDPSTAMLDAARAGRRPAWRLLHRNLLAAQQERRQPWEGLVTLVDRYGIYSLAPIVSALGLAADRGTRLSDAVLTAARSLWENTISAEREKASRRAQIVVLPATGVALALAGILIYPPFTSLTGGGITGLG